MSSLPQPGADLTALIAKYGSATHKAEAATMNRKPLVPQAQVVYFIQEEGGLVKVGVSTKAGLPRRIAELQCGNPRPLMLLGYLHGDHSDEAVIHRCPKIEGGQDIDGATWRLPLGVLEVIG